MLLGVLIAFPALARDFKYEYEGQKLTYTVINEVAKTCTTKDGPWDYTMGYYTPGNSVSGKLVIPEIAKDGDTEYTVTAIGSHAFYYCNLTEVIIPPSVTFIGRCAFESCTGLTKVNIPNFVTSIGERTFYDCRSLTEVTIPNAVTTIGSSAFYNCSGLKEVIIGNSVSYIGEKAFYGCRGLIKSAYPSNIRNPFSAGIAVGYNPIGTIIEDGWIYGPDKTSIRFAPYSLEGECVIPETVTVIDYKAFYRCNGLTSVSIPGSVTSIGSSAFEGCNGLTKAEFASIESLCSIKFYYCPLNHNAESPTS